ncbi:MAG: heavy-metal-associated domain-containing protein [Planctomycetota bacterium]
MRFVIPPVLLLCVTLFAGCASTADSSTEPIATEKPCPNCVATCSDCDEKKDCAFCTSCESKKTDAAPAAPANPTMSERVATIDAKGMSCPLCASNIDRRMQKLDGVSWTKIDLGKGQVIVGLDEDTPTPSAEDLHQAVNDAGYTAGEVTLPEEVVTP